MSEDHVDVLIIGAGISGIGAAHHLLADRPGTTFAVRPRRRDAPLPVIRVDLLVPQGRH